MPLKIEKGDNGKYFAVRKVLKIGGKKHIPSVCYPITDDIAGTVNELVAQNLATLYDEKVRFMSGRAVKVVGDTEGDGPRIVYPSPKVATEDTTAPATAAAPKKAKAAKAGDGEFSPEAAE